MRRRSAQGSALLTRLWIGILLASGVLCAPAESESACEGVPTPLTLDVETQRGVGVPSSFPMSWLLLPDAWWRGDCEVFGVSAFGFGYTASAASGSNTMDFSWEGALLSAIGTAALRAFGPFPPPPSPILIIPVDCYHLDTISHVIGGPSAYSFQVGDPGGPMIQTASGTVRFCDEVVIESSEIRMVELPYSIGVDLLAAESFGNPNLTYGLARARVLGAVDGNVVLSEQDSVVSESVIPTQRTMSRSGAVFIAAGIGQTRVRISLEAEVFIRAQARSTGLFGVISGSATAAAIMPASFVIGNFRLAGGGPLPDDVRVYSDSTGVLYRGIPNTAVSGTPGPRPGLVSDVVFANPYHPNTQISVRLKSAADDADVAVYDVQGRRVKTLHEGLLTEAALNLSWDGRTDGGFEAAVGLYYLGVSIGSHRETRSLVLLR